MESVELWIHDFKKVGERPLTQEERRVFRRRARLYWGLVLLTAAFTVGVIVAGLLALTVPFEQGWGWLFLGIWIPLWIFSFSRIAILESMASLFSRAARKPTVWVWERSERPSFGVFEYVVNVMRVPGEDEDEYLVGVGEFEKEYGSKEWLHSEKFEKELERMARGPCNRFETRETDQTVLSAEGRLAWRAVAVFMLRKPCSPPDAQCEA